MTDSATLLESAPVAVVRTLLALIADPTGCGARLEELRAAKKELEDLLITCGRREMAVEKRELAVKEREQNATDAERRSDAKAADAASRSEQLRQFEHRIDERLDAVRCREAQVKAVITRLEKSEFAGLFGDDLPDLIKPQVGKAKPPGRWLNA